MTEQQNQLDEWKLVEEPLGLYVHIPFCETKCPYCDFNTYSGIATLIPSYLQALHYELAFWGTSLSKPRVNTIFFGGGTPSLLELSQMEALLHVINDSFAIAPDAEITLEANPGDLTMEKLKGYQPLGINRLSIGVQSLNDRALQMLGRRHTAQEAIEAYRRARQAKLQNINLDFMYGMPYQSTETWRATIAKAVALEPDHLSLYSLTLELNTPMESWVRNRFLPEPDSDLAADMYLDAQEMLAQQGYKHYEISNWAWPGLESRHNLTYWRNLRYLGVGPGAHSYLPGYRFSVVRSPREYIRHTNQLSLALTPTAVTDAPSPIHSKTGESIRNHSRNRGSTSVLDTGWLESLPILDMVDPINRDLEMGETMMLGLRLSEGVSNCVFQQRFGVSLLSRYGPVIEELTEIRLLQWQGNSLTLTSEGSLLSNEVFQRFLTG